MIDSYFTLKEGGGFALSFFWIDLKLSETAFWCYFFIWDTLF